MVSLYCHSLVLDQALKAYGYEAQHQRCFVSDPRGIIGNTHCHIYKLITCLIEDNCHS